MLIDLEEVFDKHRVGHLVRESVRRALGGVNVDTGDQAERRVAGNQLLREN
jgi:hypothetical protein